MITEGRRETAQGRRPVEAREGDQQVAVDGAEKRRPQVARRGSRRRTQQGRRDEAEKEENAHASRRRGRETLAIVLAEPEKENASSPFRKDTASQKSPSARPEKRRPLSTVALGSPPCTGELHFNAVRPSAARERETLIRRCLGADEAAKKGKKKRKKRGKKSPAPVLPVKQALPDDEDSEDEVPILEEDGQNQPPAKPSKPSKKSKGKAVQSKGGSDGVMKVKKTRRGLVVLSEDCHALAISSGLYSYECLVDKKIKTRHHKTAHPLQAWDVVPGARTLLTLKYNVNATLLRSLYSHLFLLSSSFSPPLFSRLLLSLLFFFLSLLFFFLSSLSLSSLLLFSSLLFFFLSSPSFSPLPLSLSPSSFSPLPLSVLSSFSLLFFSSFSPLQDL
ncbi:hypothetical protein C7M84_005658 [Penaeus vannamei]|uniref:Uncharacterized protein n=1 Tax=Penaeus vannamei TaxID=6689 RepID=A0A3R7P598_PENVA|nr:hypothetical protein C7M84_005658 [Penaeus vannamei]